MTKLPYRKLQKMMSDLFGLDFVPASSLGFEKRTHRQAQPIHGLLVTDAYASYNAIEVEGRQSCLAHLLRKSKEIGEILAEMKTPDPASVRFCHQLKRLLRVACHITIPVGKKPREELIKRMHQILDRVCGKSELAHPKAETLRKRLLPDAREYEQVFVFIRFDGPPTNNHAERALRPLVIFRKVCLGSRSRTGSENVTIFSNLAETTKLQDGKVIDLFESLFRGSASQAHAQIFPNRPRKSMNSIPAYQTTTRNEFQGFL